MHGKSAALLYVRPSNNGNIITRLTMDYYECLAIARTLPNVWQVTSGGNVTSAVVTLYPRRQDDGSNLTCLASNKEMLAPPLSTSRTINVARE